MVARHSLMIVGTMSVCHTVTLVCYTSITFNAYCGSGSGSGSGSIQPENLPQLSPNATWKLRSGKQKLVASVCCKCSCVHLCQHNESVPFEHGFGTAAAHPCSPKSIKVSDPLTKI